MDTLRTVMKLGRPRLTARIRLTLALHTRSTALTPLDKRLRTRQQQKENHVEEKQGQARQGVLS